MSKSSSNIDPIEEGPTEEIQVPGNNDTPEDSSSIKQTINIVSKSSSNIDPIKEGPTEEIQVPGNNEIFINYVHT